MHTVGIKQLKDQLSAYIRAAADGDIVQVTDRGRVVAEIIAPRALAEATPEQRMAELVRQGLVTPEKISPQTPLPPQRQAAMSFAALMQDLDDSRADR